MKHQIQGHADAMGGLTSVDTSFLQEIPLFSTVPQPALQALASALRHRRYKKNTTIFHRHEPGNTMFILKQGRVKVTINDPSGRELIMRMIYPLDCFGEMALLDGQPRSATVIAQVASDVLILHREDLMTLIQSAPSILFNLTKALSQRVRAADELIQSLVFLDVYGKVARLLLMLAAEKGFETEEGTRIDLRLTQQDLADLSGMTRETMSRTLRSFQQAGALCVKENVITILSIERLKREIR